MKKVNLFLFLLFPSFVLFAQPWEPKTYPDELNFIRRVSGAIDKIAGKGYGVRSLAPSVCPDTGQPVYTWAVEGEEIISPFTGRRYRQGPTGYFGPKERNASSEIISFGGDPLKYDLCPVTATLMKNPGDIRARAFVNIWGNLVQQYHFAACNWARFYGFCADEMGAGWKDRFHDAVGKYEEKRRPSDGSRENQPLPRAHNLVGFPEEKEGVLGGGFTHGGTENHKTMWRTSALVYADLFPEDALISGYTISQVKEIVPDMFLEFFHRMLTVGNGEYDSHIYYPHGIYGFLNLYDFAKTGKYRNMAKFVLDYYFATYGLKCVDNTMAGAQKRGYLSHTEPSEMETLTWVYGGKGSKNMEACDVHLHQATTTYRPNKVIYNIMTHNITFPFEAKMSRPAYHMNIGNVFQESFYRSKSYALGNVAMTMVDNPNQQVVWSLVAEGKDGPLCFGGQQPFRLAPEGHSPYSQTMHHKSTLMLLTAQTGTKPDRSLTTEEQSRFEHTSEKLRSIAFPREMTPPLLREYFGDVRTSAASWLFIPKNVDRIIERYQHIFIEAHHTFLAVFPLGKYRWMHAENFPDSVHITEIFPPFRQYSVLAVEDPISGYIIDSAEKEDYGTLEHFAEAVGRKKRLDTGKLSRHLTVSYESLGGDQLKMQYVNTGLRARAWVNEQLVDYDHWADGGVYDSPYIKVKNGMMYVTDGKEGYKIDYTGSEPVYEIWNPGK